MRVAMVIQGYRPVLGGAQRQVERLGPALQRRGIEVHVVTRRPSGTTERERQPGILVHRIGSRQQGRWASVEYTARGALLARRLRPDVIHVHDLLSPSSIALLAASAPRIPVVAKVLSAGPGGDIDRLLTKPLGRPRLRAMAKRFQAFICLSEEVESELRAHGVPAERLRHIPNGVDAGVFRPPSSDERFAARRAIGVPDEAFLALYCGRFFESKRVEAIVEAARSAPVHVLLVGEGPTKASICAAVANLALEGRVRVLATVEDTVSLYWAADVYVSASETEGLSGSVLEAMSSGLPVIAAPASGMTELLGQGVGVLTPDGSAASLALALRDLAGNPPERARLGRAGRERVMSRYALEATAQQLADLYRELAVTAS